MRKVVHHRGNPRQRPADRKQVIDHRAHWNERYLTRPQFAPSRVLTEVLLQIPAPDPGTEAWAIDVAGGDGRHARWLAERGWRSVVLDISRVALERMRRECQRAPLLERARAPEPLAVEVDMEAQEQRGVLPLARGHASLIVIHHYLNRELLRDVHSWLAPGGHFVMVHPTCRNLERHTRPSARYLLDEGELAQSLTTLSVELSSEGWNDEGRHEAIFWGRRRS